MIDTLDIIGRSESLFDNDLKRLSTTIEDRVTSAAFLVLGGGGSIGRAVVKELYFRGPKKLHVVDLSENSLAELVRDLRTGSDWSGGDFSTYALDIGSDVYDKFFIEKAPYDYVLNLSALKHVRSEKDPFTLLRMIDTNILNTVKTIKQSEQVGVKKYFCVSTDKAANPVNLMGASKKIMELFAMSGSYGLDVSSARFANVAFSAGSLLESFQHRLQKRQPLVVPAGVERYFVSEEEAGQLCLLSTLFGSDGQIYFPKPDERLRAQTFDVIAERFLRAMGYHAEFVSSVSDARELAEKTIDSKEWPVITDVSDTTGEKPFEEFFTDTETLVMDQYSSIGLVERQGDRESPNFSEFEIAIENIRRKPKWEKRDFVLVFQALLPDFFHVEKFKNLDEKI